MLSFFGLFEHSFGFKIVETIGYASADFFCGLSLFFKACLHELLVAEARDELQLDRDEEESDSFKHHSGETVFNTVVNGRVRVSDLNFTWVDDPHPLKTDGRRPRMLIGKGLEWHLVDQLQEDVKDQIGQHKVLQDGVQPILSFPLLQEVNVVEQEDHDEDDVAE